MGDFAAKLFPIALAVEIVLFMVYKSIWYRIRMRSIHHLEYAFIGGPDEFERIKFMNQTGITQYEVVSRYDEFSDIEKEGNRSYDG